MFKSLALLLLCSAATLSALPSTAPAEMDIQSVLKAEDSRLRWDDVLERLDNQGKLKMMSFTAASGAVAGALAGLSQDSVGGAMVKVPEPGVELPLPGGMDAFYGAAAGAALGSLLGASHIAFVDSAISDQLRDDPHNPLHLRMHLFQLVPRMQSHVATLALNASF